MGGPCPHPGQERAAGIFSWTHIPFKGQRGTLREEETLCSLQEGGAEEDLISPSVGREDRHGNPECIQLMSRGTEDTGAMCEGAAHQASQHREMGSILPATL